MVLNKIRNSVLAKSLALYLCFSLLADLIWTTNQAFALTGGPSQPEVQSFSPVGTSDMVDLSSGDFKYNIPLLDVGGYPINLIYNSGIGMDQEASWVGLGWNINPGVINRNMRGLPDDFDGDIVEKTFYMKPNKTFGASLGLNFELFGKESDGSLKKFVEKYSEETDLSYELGITYNNYTGIGLSQTLALEANKNNGTASLGLTASQNGLTISPSISYSKNVKNKKDKVEKSGKAKSTVGIGLNSRSGLTSMSIDMSTKMDIVDDGKKCHRIELKLVLP